MWWKACVNLGRITGVAYLYQAGDGDGEGYGGEGNHSEERYRPANMCVRTK